MKKRTKIVLLSFAIIVTITFPLALLAQFGIDNTNYQKEYIDSLEPIKTRDITIDETGVNTKFYNVDCFKVMFSIIFSYLF